MKTIGLDVASPTPATNVVFLGAYRAAKHAGEFMLGAIHQPAWLHHVGVEVTADGGAVVLVVLNWETEVIRGCLPTAVNNIPVVVRALGQGGA